MSKQKGNIKMELEINTIVWIEINEIIAYMKEENLPLEIAVEEYIACLDDCDHYLVNNEECKEKIRKKVKETLDKQ
jgi:hypothetical protein